MTTDKNLTDRIALTLNSLGFVILAMFATKTMQVVFSHGFYASAFPNMRPWEAIGATWSLAIGWELALLIVTMNSQYVPKWLRYALTVASGINMLFFIDAFNPALTGPLFYGRLFIGVISTSIDLVYITIFGKKWSERKVFQALPDLNAKLQADLQKATAKEQKATKDLQKATADLEKATADLQQLAAKVQQFEAKLRCPYCDESFETSASLNTHKGRYCSKNPKNGMDAFPIIPLKKMNGHNP